MKGSKSEVLPRVWRPRVYVGRQPGGGPVQVSKSVRSGDGRAVSGARAADREFAVMVAEANRGNRTTGATTVRKYNEIAERTVRPESGTIRLDRISARDLESLDAKLTA